MSDVETGSVEAAQERLRVAVTRAVDAFVDREGTAEQFTTWAEIVERFAGKIAADPPGSVLWGIGARGVFGVSGQRSAPPLERLDTGTVDRVQAVVTFGPEHEGHRGFAHGGVTASVFDELFGMLWTFDQPPKVTEELTLRFVTLAPLRRMIRLEARADSAEGNRFTCAGRMFDGETVFAEATAVFVATRRAG